MEYAIRSALAWFRQVIGRDDPRSLDLMPSVPAPRVYPRTAAFHPLTRALSSPRAYGQLFAQPSPAQRAERTGQATFPAMRAQDAAARAMLSPGRYAAGTRSGIPVRGMILPE